MDARRQVHAAHKRRLYRGRVRQTRPDEAQRKRSIESIDITGNAAVVKVLLDYPSARLTEYMSMLKIDGEWKIVNKTFVSEPKTR
ncbi:MAG TPA: nuclear transport factor 2 family protein [Pyrinomonadaceae bacterium]|nr:nuclear transport factor 2 family protein [Pyrinomonadaceae bacterium]